MGLPTAATLRHIFPQPDQQAPPTFEPGPVGELEVSAPLPPEATCTMSTMQVSKCVMLGAGGWEATARHAAAAVKPEHEATGLVMGLHNGLCLCLSPCSPGSKGSRRLLLTGCVQM